MMHTDRVWCVNAVESAEELAHKLTEMTWCSCTAFELGSYLWLNDSTCPDGAQEFAVVKKLRIEGKLLQVESITFSWCDEATALKFIRQTLDGHDDNNEFSVQIDPALETPAEHGRCHLCA